MSIIIQIKSLPKTCSYSVICIKTMFNVKKGCFVMYYAVVEVVSMFLLGTRIFVYSDGTWASVWKAHLRTELTTKLNDQRHSA